MSPKGRCGPGLSDDTAVSEVIGVILMVAITVAIAATVYIWAGGFGDSGQGPESASATAKVVSLDGDNDAEWIKLTLTAGDNAPYTNSSTEASIAASTGSWNGICESPQKKTTSPTAKCQTYFSGSWDVGSSKWFPCQNGNRHSLSLAVEQTAILDRTVTCEESA